MKPRYTYYLFIGNSADEIGRKSIRFIVETSYPMENETHFSGRVVARANNAMWHVNYESSSWCSPIGDAKAGMFTSFVRVSRSYVKEHFPDHVMGMEFNEM